MRNTVQDIYLGDTWFQFGQTAGYPDWGFCSIFHYFPVNFTLILVMIALFQIVTCLKLWKLSQLIWCCIIAIVEVALFCNLRISQQHKFHVLNWCIIIRCAVLYK